MRIEMIKTLKMATCLSAVLMMTACGGMADRLANVGKAPELAKIENPYKQPNYKPVSMPMPPQNLNKSKANSLWQAGRQTFFKDQRANQVGDILTVLIEINDTADLDNKTERTRSGSETAGLPNLFGLESQLAKQALPEALDTSKLVDMNTDSTSTGDGTIQRAETISLKLAAMITQTLPNGNLIISGHQQVRVNHELRDLSLQGVIRPEDVLSNNSISYEKIAEARISYGGEGNISELQQPRYGQQVMDIILPF